MKCKVTSITFDFDEEDDMDAYDKDKLAVEYIGEVFTVDDEDSLVDVISDASGWCINSIEYEVQGN